MEKKRRAEQSKILFVDFIAMMMVMMVLMINSFVNCGASN